MADEFETVHTSNFDENQKTPDKLFSPRSYSGDDDSIRSWQSSMTDDSNNFEHYLDTDKTFSFDTSLETSQSLNYTESCETYKSESIQDSFDTSSGIYSRPETPYNKFLERLKDASCVDIVSAIKGLVVMLPGNMVRSEVATISHNFIDIYTPKLLSLEIFSKLSDDEKAETIECFEKFTMQKLYPQCYRMDPMDAIEDEKLEIQMLCLNWIEPHHLEITTMGDPNILREAQNQLKNLYKYRSPRDKLIIILNFCRLVVYSIQKITNKDVSCDEAFPLLILTIILTNPAQLQSCIEFIQYFRHPSRHISEEAYAFTLLVSAVEFIKQIGTSSQLKINTQDFQKKYNQNKAKYQTKLSHLKQLTLENTNNNNNNSDNFYNNNDNGNNSNNTNRDNEYNDNTNNGDTNNNKENSVSKMSTTNNVLDQFKKFNLSTMFKVPLFKQNNNELYEIIESLDYLESYLLDLPLSYQYKDNSLDSPDLINDWRALVAMKKHVTETIATIKNRAKKLL